MHSFEKYTIWVERQLKKVCIVEKQYLKIRFFCFGTLKTLIIIINQCRVRLRLQYQVALMRALNTYAHVQNRGRRIQWRWWSRAWLDPRSNDMFDEIIDRVGTRITKQYTFCIAPLDHGMQLAITLRYVASGSKYTDMWFDWHVPNNKLFLFSWEDLVFFLITSPWTSLTNDWLGLGRMPLYGYLYGQKSHIPMAHYGTSGGATSSRTKTAFSERRSVLFYYRNWQREERGPGISTPCLGLGLAFGYLAVRWCGDHVPCTNTFEERLSVFRAFHFSFVQFLSVTLILVSVIVACIVRRLCVLSAPSPVFLRYGIFKYVFLHRILLFRISFYQSDVH